MISKDIKRKIKTALLNLLQPRTIVFFVALFNFVWFFSQSRSVVEFGSTSISFCYFCPWYWDWSLTNLPSLSLIAAACLLFSRWKIYLVACLISGYQIIDGLKWASNTSGLLSGLLHRLEIISESNSAYPVWDLLDIQYLLASIIFVTAIAYLAGNVFGTKRTTTVSVP